MAVHTLPYLRTAVSILGESVQYSPSIEALQGMAAGAYSIARSLQDSGAPRAAVYAVFFAGRALANASSFDHREGHAYAGAYHAARAYLDSARDTLDHALNGIAAIPLEKLQGWPSE